MKSVPAIRIRNGNDLAVRAEGRYVLYWMIANRRLSYNYSLDRALEYCRELHKPLLVFEALRCDYQWASDRLHHFVMQGMADNRATCNSNNIEYFPYVEPKLAAGKGLLQALADDACVVVTDEFPCFFLPRMVEAAAKKIPVKLEEVDSNGILPLRAADQVFGRAYDFRRFLQKTLSAHLDDAPAEHPLQKNSQARALVSKDIIKRWPATSAETFATPSKFLKSLPIDHDVAPSAIGGGHSAARNQLQKFLSEKLALYGEHRNEPESNIASGLSPYLHFGHISAHEVFAQVVQIEKWTPKKLALRGNGSREGWWNMSANAEGFLDEFITWREVGYNFSSKRADYDCYDSLPDWAQKTLQQHAADKREHLYSLEQLETGKTYDSLWNASQLQLVQEGHIHNYLRMLWGKKILEWSKSPQAAAEVMIQLNNKYGLDGRNPNSYSGIFWCLGRYDRPWGPERPIFGLIRYMSSDNTARKVRVKNYILKYAGVAQGQLNL